MTTQLTLISVPAAPSHPDADGVDRAEDGPRAASAGVQHPRPPVPSLGDRRTVAAPGAPRATPVGSTGAPSPRVDGVWPPPGPHLPMLTDGSRSDTARRRPIGPIVWPGRRAS